MGGRVRKKLSKKNLIRGGRSQDLREFNFISMPSRKKNSASKSNKIETYTLAPSLTKSAQVISLYLIFSISVLAFWAALPMAFPLQPQQTPDGSMVNSFGSSFSYEANITDTPNGRMAPYRVWACIYKLTLSARYLSGIREPKFFLQLTASSRAMFTTCRASAKRPATALKEMKQMLTFVVLATIYQIMLQVQATNFKFCYV